MDVSINSSTIIANYKDGQLMEPWGYLLAAAVLLLIGLVGFTLNLIVVILMCRHIKVSEKIITELCSRSLKGSAGNTK